MTVDLCDKKVSLKFKVIFYTTVARPTMMNGSECEAFNKRD